ncbi:nuclear mRNA splicing factor-associated protein [Histoplasma capsulatum var. duboisii H88]|uniref:Nuclear mRNA splicing factor-associated protein n=1 Tax=Ajellomyces capsulatus (strain H88) TaxID=544711 RepID=F0UCR0_AJEC8|nr:nuclear mRNA splicing factor-associated protein [Histoplasma capsulatum var. duboisii H88]QSS49520.1 splicing factor U2AF-associated protein [Histoplasma capsulatum var. duboisii H88]
MEAPPIPHEQSTATRKGFPQSPDEFDDDYRISYSKLENKYILEAEDGSEWYYDDALKRWVPMVDNALLEQQGEAYKVEGIDEHEPADFKQQRRLKRKNYTNCEEENKQSQAHKAKKSRVNTAVYVTSIPLDATIEEVNNVFSKCGVIAEEIDRRRPRIKMYTDDEGKFKGDALIVYFRPESVNLAIQMLDDTDFRLGETGPDGKMKVQTADYSFKVQKDAPTKPNMNEKRKIMKKTQRLNSKLADWDDDEPSMAPQSSSRWDKVVILKHMFTLQELEEDPAAILDIKEDIRQECSKLGDVTNVVLYDKEEDGVASVRFADVESAKICVQKMDGRFFSGTRVAAYIADGSERFRKSSSRHATTAGTTLTGVDAEDDSDQADEEEAERLDKFGSWLEGGDGDDDEAARESAADGAS